MAKAVSRSVPTVEKVLRTLGKTDLPRSVTAVVVRRELAAARSAKRVFVLKGFQADVRKSLANLRRAQHRPAANGTGIIALSRPGTGSEVVRTLLKVPKAELARRAEKLKMALEAMPMKTTIGVGRSHASVGKSPPSTKVSVTLDLLPLTLPLPEFAAQLRAGTPPIFGYIAGGRFKLDLRTISPHQDERLFRAIYKVFGI